MTTKFRISSAWVSHLHAYQLVHSLSCLHWGGVFFSCISAGVKHMA